MREIKFRAWDKITKQMIISNNMPDAGFWDMVAHNEFEQDIVMQYTGLKDKNGREIFEGDICKVHNHAALGGNLYCVIEFNDRTGSYYGRGVGSLKFSMGEDMEVIGNIFENPELRKERINNGQNKEFRPV